MKIKNIFPLLKRAAGPKIKAGFTVLEVLLAIFILIIAVFGSFSLIEKTLIASSLNQSKLTAYYLAQEGVEIVRNIRDTNWLQGRDWAYGLAEGEQEADYLSLSLEAWQARNLKIDGSGFYNYASGSETRFKRKIIIQAKTDTDNDGYLEVEVVVEWSERGRTHEARVMNYLYDWY